MSGLARVQAAYLFWLQLKVPICIVSSFQINVPLTVRRRQAGLEAGLGLAPAPAWSRKFLFWGSIKPREPEAPAGRAQCQSPDRLLLPQQDVFLVFSITRMQQNRGST